jgi:hypothetical protein
MDTIKSSVLFNNLCQTENVIYTRKSLAEAMLVNRFRNVSGFVGAIKQASAIGTKDHALLEKELIQSNGNKDA